MAILIGLHNIIRWVVVLFAVIALLRAYRGWLQKLDWNDRDRKVGVFFGAAMDTQLLIGIILWIFGNWGIKAFDIPASEGISRMTVLFFAVEHAFSMLAAVVLVHVGSVLSRKAQLKVDKHKWSAIFFTIAVLLIAIAIPWTQRPLFPGL